MVDIHLPHAEVIDPTTRHIWQSIEPCDRGALAALDLPKGQETRLLSVGSGCVAMDERWFDRSPGADEDGAMQERTIDGRRFGHCATPVAGPFQPFGETGPNELSVDKHHALRFIAGRSVSVLRLPEGDDYVHVVDRATFLRGERAASGANGLDVPQGCVLGTITLDEDWVLRLPNPTRVFFFANGDSYQGPIASLPAAWEPLR